MVEEKLCFSTAILLSSMCTSLSSLNSSEGKSESSWSFIFRRIFRNSAIPSSVNTWIIDHETSFILATPARIFQIHPLPYVERRIYRPPYQSRHAEILRRRLLVDFLLQEMKHNAPNCVPNAQDHLDNPRHHSSGIREYYERFRETRA